MRSFVKAISFFILLLSCKPSTPVPEQNLVSADFFVSPVGSDSNPGTFQEPFASFEAAAAAVQKKLANGQQAEVRVVFRGGVYLLNKTTTLTPGIFEKKVPIIFESYPGERASFTGTDKPKKTSVRGSLLVFDSESDPQNLYSDGKRISSVRWPQTGFLSINEPQNGVVDISAYPQKERNRLKKGTVGLKIFSSLKDAPGDKLLPFSIDSKIKLSGKKLSIEMSNSLSTLLSAGVFYIEPGKSALQVESSYYFDIAEKTVSVKKTKFIPDKGLSEPLFTIAGTESEQVANLIFRGLDFSQTASGNDLLNIRYSNNLLFENCFFRLSGRDGMGIGPGSSEIRIQNCSFESLYRHGIYAGGQPEKKGNITSITIQNNSFVSAGTSGYGSAIKAYGLYSSTISNNWIRDISSAAISITSGPEEIFIAASSGHIDDSFWDQKNFYSMDNLVKQNDCMNCLTSGTGFGIIELLCSGYNTIQENYIHESTAPSGRYSGIYLGEKAYSCLIFGNMIAMLGKLPLGGKAESACTINGRDHVIENNYTVLNNAESALSSRDGRQNPVKELYIGGNVFYNTGSLVYDFACYGRNYLKHCDANLIYSDSYAYHVRTIDSTMEMDEWKKKHDKISMISNPLFESAESSDYRLKTKSPAWMLGIPAFDFSLVGRIGLQSLRENDILSNRTFNLFFDVSARGSWLSLESGQSIKVTAYCIQQDGIKTIIPSEELKFELSTPNVIEIENGFLIKSISRGKTELTITAGKKEANLNRTIEIFVDDSSDRTGILPVPMMNVNEKVQIKAYDVSKWEIISAITDPIVQIENLALAEYKNGYLSALKSGTTKIVIGDEIREVKIIEAPMEVYLEAVAADFLFGAEKTASAVTGCAPGGYLVFRNVNFFNGFRQCSVQLAQPPEYSDAIIEIRLGSQTGALICVMPVKPTKSWGDFQWQNFNLYPYNEKTASSDEALLFQNAIKGIQDVFVVFKGTSPSGTIIGIKFDISAQKQSEQFGTTLPVQDSPSL